MRTATVYLLGAGPGDPGLITVRALRKLREADVVLYDALVHPDLLQHCKEGAEIVFVGKRAGRSSERQAEINDRMIQAAKSGRLVARLKGGDPSLFARASEEVEALCAANVPFEIVPGVSSPSAAAAYAGLVLTDRHASSSVAYVTATESIEKDESIHDWDKLATATQTLVLFMGMRKLGSLMQRLIDHGRDPKTPAAVVQWASLPKQRTVTGTVDNIADRAAEAGLGLPALTIVGNTVHLRSSLQWFERKPLFGKRVLVTRPKGQSKRFSEMLRDAGAEPVELPSIRIAPPQDSEHLVNAVRDLPNYDWVVFTSQNGVEFFLQALSHAGYDARRFSSARICAIGPRTSEALQRHGLRADVVPDVYEGEAAARALMAHTGKSVSGARVLLPRAAVARERLPQVLREHGAHVDIVSAYQTLPVSPEDRQAIRKTLEARAIDVVTFTSSSTVDNLVSVLGSESTTLLSSCVIAAIGPVTEETARRHGLDVQVSASEYTAEGLVAALIRHFGGRS